MNHHFCVRNQSPSAVRPSSSIDPQRPFGGRRPRSKYSPLTFLFCLACKKAQDNVTLRTLGPKGKVYSKRMGKATKHRTYFVLVRKRTLFLRPSSFFCGRYSPPLHSPFPFTTTQLDVRRRPFPFFSPSSSSSNTKSTQAASLPRRSPSPWLFERNCPLSSFFFARWGSEEELERWMLALAAAGKKRAARPINSANVHSLPSPPLLPLFPPPQRRKYRSGEERGAFLEQCLLLLLLRPWF